MKLLVDLGNTRLKWAWLDKSGLLDPGAESHHGHAGQGLFAGLLHQMHRPDEIRLASVASPDLTAAILGELGRIFDGAPVRIEATKTVARGVRNGYRQPGQLGVDRWLAIVAAFTRHRRALCVVDAGTAVTIDAVAGDGLHLGGFIVPGPALMRDALLRETGRLEAAASAGRRAPDDAGPWGRDTESCIRHGARGAIAALVGRSLGTLAGQGGASPVLVLTGGDAPALLDELPGPADLRPLLVLEGLAATCAEPDGPHR